LVLVLASLAFVSLAPGCGGAPAHTARAGGGRGLPITAGARLFFEAARDDGAVELTVAVTESGAGFSYELACGRVARPTTLPGSIEGTVDAATLDAGREIYRIDRCEQAQRLDGALPAFLVSRRAATALEHHERTMLHLQHHEPVLGLRPVGRETITVRIDGQPVAIDTIHARDGNVDLWIAEGDTPIVVRETEGRRSLTLDAIDTGHGPVAAAPTRRARP
jgi:hypothetical protein